jgi:poly(3-hydroxybutyrate) depolymerase
VKSVYACGPSRRLVCAALALVLLSAVGQADTGSKSIACGKLQQDYVYFTPEKLAKAGAAEPAPVVVLLHGAGDRAENMIEAWKRFARKQGIVLLAPRLPREIKYEEFAPQAFRCVVEDARKSIAIDPSRVYIFGNSMGGYLGYDAAMFQSRYFAAVAVHGMRIADDFAWIVTRAERKTPIAIYIGDHDQFSSEESVRRTRDLLLKSGFPVHYVALVSHDHNYYAIADEINADAWKFFESVRLPADTSAH